MSFIENNDLPNVATCQAGLEPILVEEMKQLSIRVGFSGQRMVSFWGNETMIYRANMALRTAINVLVPIKKFRAKDYRLLYFQSRKIPWHRLFTADQTIRIDVKGQSHRFPNSQYCIHRIKDGIVDTFRKLCNGTRPSINKRNPDIHVVAYFHDDEITLYMDSSGQPLFKRGYRVRHGEAPLKEDLAAGILLLSGWKGQRPFLDPMCGSGTFLFEAYMIAANIPPNLNRNFAFMNWRGFTPALHTEEREKLRAKIKPCDIDIKGYEKNSDTFGVLNDIMESHFPSGPIDIVQQDFRSAKATFKNHFVVTNPPYGERIKLKDLDELYSDSGHFFRKNCPQSTIAVFTAYLQGPRLFGLRAGMKRKLHNGSLPARLLVYEIE